MPDLPPHLEILSQAQRLVWPDLRPATALGFALYEGTAIALRLGHRSSIDFDFFCGTPLGRVSLYAAMPFLKIARVLQDIPDALTFLVAPDERSSDTVKISFVGSITFGRVGIPQWTSDVVAQIASPEDLLGTKMKVIPQRIEEKDYIDTVALLENGTSLAIGLGAACTLFGAAFQPSECLKALAYFEGGDLDGLAQSAKDKLIASVSAVDDLPRVSLLDHRLTL